MIGTTDIPDWCYVEACGTTARHCFTEPPSADDLTLLYNKSPISHVSKVCTLSWINTCRLNFAGIYKSSQQNHIEERNLPWSLKRKP